MSHDVYISIPDRIFSLEEKRLWLKELCDWGTKNLENTNYWYMVSKMYKGTKHITDDTDSVLFLCTNEEDAISLKLTWT